MNLKLYKQIYKIMLPGDYIAMKLTGKINTTVSGLSEGIFWDLPKMVFLTGYWTTLVLIALSYRRQYRHLHAEGWST